MTRARPLEARPFDPRGVDPRRIDPRRIDPRRGRLAAALEEHYRAEGARLDGGGPARVWLIVPCKGRLGYLRRSLRRIVESTDFHVCLVDYSCPERCGDWFEATYGHRNGERQLVVQRCEDQELFNKSAAHNAGAWRALREGADYLCFLDADTLVSPEFGGFVRSHMGHDRFLIAGLRPDGTDMPSMTGLLVTPAGKFAEVGGFDESFCGWGAEDIEMRLRLHLVGGLVPADVPVALATPIPHGNELRTQYYQVRDPAASNAANIKKILEKIRGKWRASDRLHLPSTQRLWFRSRFPLEFPTDQDARIPPGGPDQVPELAPAKISCLCVTENRPEFMEWVLWGFDRQTYADKELVIVDSSPVPFRCDRPDVRVVAVAPGMSVPAKRNRALAEADGEYLAWFDDDDWHHPQRLELLQRALAGSDVHHAGCSRSYFVDLFSDGVRSYNGHGHIIFNGALFRRQAVASIRFDESKRRASDTPWLRDVRVQVGSPIVLRDGVLCAWLSHETNISNPRMRRRYPERLDALEACVGPVAWADTTERLARLRAALPLPAQAPTTQSAPRTTVLHQTRGRAREGRRFERRPSAADLPFGLASSEPYGGELKATIAAPAVFAARLRASSAQLFMPASMPEAELASEWAAALADALGVRLASRDGGGGDDFALWVGGPCLARTRCDSFFDDAVRRLKGGELDWVGCFPARSTLGAGRVRTGQLVDRAILGPRAFLDARCGLYRGVEAMPLVVVTRATLARSLASGAVSLSALAGGVTPSQDAWSLPRADHRIRGGVGATLPRGGAGAAVASVRL